MSRYYAEAALSARIMYLSQLTAIRCIEQCMKEKDVTEFRCQQDSDPDGSPMTDNLNDRIRRNDHFYPSYAHITGSKIVAINNTDWNATQRK